MAEQNMWQKTKKGSKYGFDKLWGYADKLGAPVNKLSNKLGSEAFWPTTLDKESEKAARILRSFCKDGFYQEELHKTIDGPKQKQKVLKKIPPEVIRKAQGLAIFTTMRTGLWISGAGGSGVLVGRMEDGSWSPPAGILLHTAGLGFLVGVDIYDCVLVINTKEALSAFSKWRATVGGEISAVAGPVGVGGYLETELHKRQAPIFTYLKSRGFYAGVQIDGTVIIERTDENERFYLQKLSAQEIISGKVRHPPFELRMLEATLKAAQGDKDVDKSLLSSEPAPADYEVVEEGHIFGVPDREDPDPYGVLALEKEGLVIKEAGTKTEASMSEFDFRPKIDSPVFNTFRRSFESTSHASTNDWRRSAFSTNNESRYVTSDMSTQTDLPPSATESPELRSMENQNGLGSAFDSPKSARSLFEDKSTNTYAPIEASHHVEEDDEDEGDEDYEDEDGESYDDDDEAVVHEVHQAAAPQAITRARLVTLPQRLAPKLPARNPIRTRILPVQTSPGQQEDSETPARVDRGDSVTSSTHSNKSTFSHEGHLDGITSPASSPEKAESVRFAKLDASSPEKAESFKSIELDGSPEPTPALDDHIPGRFPSGSPAKSPVIGEGRREETRVVSNISLSSIRDRLGSDDDDD